MNTCVRIGLLDAVGKTLRTVTTAVGNLAAGKEICLPAKASIRDPQLWSAETPYLYTVNLELLDASGKEWRLHEGKLDAVAPTLLRMWGIAQPEAMTGTPLVEEAHVR